MRSREGDSRPEEWLPDGVESRPPAATDGPGTPDAGEWLPPGMAPAEPEVGERDTKDSPVVEPAAQEPAPAHAAKQASADDRPAAAEIADLNTLDFEYLREIGLSITQATRVLALRERVGRFSSLEQLDSLTGFPDGQLEHLKSSVRLTPDP